MNVSLKIPIVTLVILSCSCSIRNKTNASSHLIFKDDFENDLSDWVAETEKSGTTVEITNGKLVIDAPGGVTLWLKKRLEGNVQIEFTRKVVVAGGPNDRLSDFNLFWMATDPRNDDLFTRKGRFNEYHPLKLYYAGFGGNNNSTTRFRRYDGTGTRELLQEYTDDEHLLKPNKEYNIKVVCRDGKTQFFVDGERYFSYQDKEPLVSGYFGFRLVGSHQEIDRVRVYSLD